MRPFKAEIQTNDAFGGSKWEGQFNIKGIDVILFNSIVYSHCSKQIIF